MCFCAYIYVCACFSLCYFDSCLLCCWLLNEMCIQYAPIHAKNKYMRLIMKTINNTTKRIDTADLVVIIIALVVQAAASTAGVVGRIFL